MTIEEWAEEVEGVRQSNFVFQGVSNVFRIRNGWRTKNGFLFFFKGMGGVGVAREG